MPSATTLSSERARRSQRGPFEVVHSTDLCTGRLRSRQPSTATSTTFLHTAVELENPDQTAINRCEMSSKSTALSTGCAQLRGVSRRNSTELSTGSVAAPEPLSSVGCGPRGTTMPTVGCRGSGALLRAATAGGCRGTALDRVHCAHVRARRADSRRPKHDMEDMPCRSPTSPRTGWADRREHGAHSAARPARRAERARRHAAVSKDAVADVIEIAARHRLLHPQARADLRRDPVAVLAR